MYKSMLCIHVIVQTAVTCREFTHHNACLYNPLSAPETQPVVIAVSSVVAVIIILSIGAAILSIIFYLAVYKKRGTFAIHSKS